MQLLTNFLQNFSPAARFSLKIGLNLYFQAKICYNLPIFLKIFACGALLKIICLKNLGLPHGPP